MQNERSDMFRNGFTLHLRLEMLLKKTQLNRIPFHGSFHRVILRFTSWDDIHVSFEDRDVVSLSLKDKFLTRIMSVLLLLQFFSGHSFWSNLDIYPFG